MFLSFILITLLVFWPGRNKPYQGAEKLALKEDGDPIITPRHPETSDKRTES